MGTWGTGILDDDLARDVYDRYMDAQGAGESPDAIVRALQQDFAGAVADPDEGPLFWLAVAQAQWECAHLSPGIAARVQDIVANGAGLARWAESGRAELARRKAALSRFAKKIQSAPARAPRREAPSTEVPFAVGDCLAIDVDNGQFGAAVVTRYEPGPHASHILSIVDFLDTSPPDASVFAPPSWLVVTDAPNLTIVKYIAYANGYKRHGKKYRVVSRIQLSDVPPPLTLGLGNWGKIWRDLGERLRRERVSRGQRA